MPTTQAVHAFVLAALDDAIGRLDRGGSISDDNLHQLRKAVKRARAGLRLLRHAISDDSLRKENALLRDTGRAFAAIRDRASLIEALDLLDAGRKEPATPVRRRQIELAGKLLRARRASARANIVGAAPWAERSNNCTPSSSSSLAIALLTAC